MSNEIDKGKSSQTATATASSATATTESAKPKARPATRVQFEMISNEVTRANLPDGDRMVHVGTLSRKDGVTTFFPVTSTFIGVAEMKEILAQMEYGS